SGALPGLDHATIHFYPLPHHIPKYPGGVSLRFAMVHDVIHERFARHGQAYYEERNRRVRQELDRRKGEQSLQRMPSADYLALFEDRGAGLDYVGRHGEAVTVLRDKLKLQKAHGFRGRQLYTTYANLGTFLIHGNFHRAMTGNQAGKNRLREGLWF